jgi:hypothetical protein
MGHFVRGPLGRGERDERLAKNGISRGTGPREPVRIPVWGEARGAGHAAMVKNVEQRLKRILFSVHNVKCWLGIDS